VGRMGIAITTHNGTYALAVVPSQAVLEAGRVETITTHDGEP
jgi:hypothetical protein